MHRRKFMSAGFGALLGAGGWTAFSNGWQPTLPGAEDSAGQPENRVYRGADLVFGTTVGIRLRHRDEKLAQLAIRAALDEARKVDALMSIYRQSSQVAELNRTGVVENPDPHLVRVLQTATDLSEMTDGAFDVTVQPLWTASRDGRDTGSAHALIDWRKLTVTGKRIRLLQQDMAITLNGIAQGYATDLALAALREHGILHALVDIGEFGSLGRHSTDRPWTVGIRHPRRLSENIASLQMDGRCIATSGDYETAFTSDFSKHHIFDPRTGQSPQQLASATVIAPSGIMADGLSTAFMVLGKEKSAEIAASLPDVDALLIDKRGREWRTEKFPALAG